MDESGSKCMKVGWMKVDKRWMKIDAGLPEWSFEKYHTHTLREEPNINSIERKNLVISIARRRVS